MNVIDIVTKLIAVVQAIESNPNLLAAIMAVVNLFHPATPTPVPAAQMTALKEAFEASPQVHQAMQANGLATASTSLTDLFNKFLELLPFIAQVLALFGKTA